MEESLTAICRGQETKNTFMQNAVQAYEDMFTLAQNNQQLLVESLRKYLFVGDSSIADVPNLTNATNEDFSGMENVNSNSSARSTAKPKCECELFATKKTVSKNGPNKGRKFWTCTRVSGKCSFFQWAEAEEEPPKREKKAKRSRKRAT